MIKISILIPIYNTAPFLKQCIESVLNQTLKDIEIICLNDGSTDSSQLIIDEYARKDDRIKVVHKKNTGYGHTMNIGISLAKGEYIGIVESDDYIISTMFETLYETLIQVKPDVIKSDYYFLYEQGTTRANIFKDINCNNTYSAKDNPLLFYMTPCIWSAIYKSEFLQMNNIFFNETPGASYQDLSFSLKVWLKAKNIVLIDQPLLYYRHDNPNSSIYAENKMFCVIEEFNEIRRYVNDDIHSIKNDLQFIDKTAYIIFNGYINMVSPPHKFAFIVKVSEYYKKWEVALPLNNTLLDKQEKTTLDQIINQPEQALKQYLTFDDKRISMESMASFSLNTDIYIEGIINYLKSTSSIIIYGAGIVGDFVYQLLQIAQLDSKICAYCISSLTVDSFINGYPIKSFEETLLLYPNALYLVAISDQHQFEILKNLRIHGCKQVISMNAELRRILNRKFQLHDQV